MKSNQKDDYNVQKTDIKEINCISKHLRNDSRIKNLRNCRKNIDFSKLPYNLQSLTLNGNFNHKLKNLPPSLKILNFGMRFNQKLENLPYGLETLTFGTYFNQKLENLPSSLRRMTFSQHFNQQMNVCVALPQLQKIILKDGQHIYHTIPPLFNTTIYLKSYSKKFRKFVTVKKIIEDYKNFGCDKWKYIFFKSINV